MSSDDDDDDANPFQRLNSASRRSLSSFSKRSGSRRSARVAHANDDAQSFVDQIDAPPDVQKAIDSIRTFNWFLLCFHGVVNALVLGVLIGVGVLKGTVPVTLATPQGRPGNYTADMAGKLEDVIFTFNPQWLSFTFSVICAIAHAATLVWIYRGWYTRMIYETNNYLRWIEYSLSASIMLVQILLINQITDFGALLFAFFLNATMIYFGQLYEEFPKRQEFFVAGSVVGAIPWVIIYTVYIRAAVRSPVPWFVHVVVIGILAQFFVFAFIALRNNWNLNKVTDPDERARLYLKGEWWYNFLSLTAKTFLVWILAIASAT